MVSIVLAALKFQGVAKSGLELILRHVAYCSHISCISL